MPHTINSEPNNNTFTSLTTSITGKRDIDISMNKNDSQVINVSGLQGVYIQSDKYRPFTIFDSDNEKFAVLPPSTTGSLTSITTTSVASSEPDHPGSDKGGDDGGNDELTGKEWANSSVTRQITRFHKTQEIC